MLSSTAAVVACVIWVLAGLTGHEPWKPDEAYSIGVALHVLQSGDLVVPMLGGEPFMEKPPLLYLTGALFAHVFGSWLPLHDAMRLSLALYLGLTLLAVAGLARESRVADAPLNAPLLFIAGLGLFELAHRFQTDIPLMAGIALALYGLALTPRRTALAGLLLGTGTGIAFLSKGIIGPAFVGLSTVALLLLPNWRQSSTFKCWGFAIVSALPWLLIWPALLWSQSPENFHQWFWVNNVSRFLPTESTGLGPQSDAWFYSKTLPWFAWPAIPLAAWGAWRVTRHHTWTTAPALQVCAASFISMLSLLAIAHDARGNYALPLLPPLAVLAAAGIAQLSANAQRRWAIAGSGLYSLLLGTMLIAWALRQFGGPAAVLTQLDRLQPGYVEPLRALTVSLACIISVLWLTSLRWLGQHPAWTWGAGMAAAWSVFALLWIPTVDHGRSYKTVMTGIAQHIDHNACVSSLGYGEPQRAMLDYYANVKAERLEVKPHSNCPQLLVQNSFAPEGQGWTLIWEGSRPNDTREPHRLYRKN